MNVSNKQPHLVGAAHGRRRRRSLTALARDRLHSRRFLTLASAAQSMRLQCRRGEHQEGEEKYGDERGEV